MNDTPNRRGALAGRLHEDTQRLVKELMDENEKLQRIAASLERDNAALQQQLSTLVAEMERQQREKTSLRTQLDTIERQSRDLTLQFADLEQRSADLANLYVSSYQLHGTLDRDAVLTAIREIIINLVGSEHFGIYELSDDEDTFELVASFGLEAEANRRFSTASDPLGRVATAGETYLAARAVADLPPLVACVPLKLDGRVTGAIVLFSLLPHKESLQELDLELFDLLSSHAATALYCTSLRRRLESGAAA